MPLFGKKEPKDDSNKETNLNPFAKKPDNGNNNQKPDDKSGKPDDAIQAGKPAPDFDMTKFYKDSGLYDGINMEDFTTAVREGDAEKAGTIMAKVMENSVSVALTNANKLADQKVAAIRDSVISETKTSAEMDVAIREMNESLPFTSHEAVAPLAKTILEGFLNQGLPTKEAVSRTSDYYKEVAKESGQHFGMDMREEGDTDGFGRSRMRDEHDNSNHNPNDKSGNEDWIDTLTSGHQTQEGLDEANKPSGE